MGLNRSGIIVLTAQADARLQVLHKKIDAKEFPEIRAAITQSILHLEQAMALARAPVPPPATTTAPAPAAPSVPDSPPVA